MPVLIKGSGGGAYQRYEYVLENTEIAIGKRSITIPCSFAPKAVLLMATKLERGADAYFSNLVVNFGHFPEYGFYFDQKRNTGTREYSGAFSNLIDDNIQYQKMYDVQYSNNSVTVNILDEEYGFASYFDVIVFG